jgi:regulatory protein YycI of two-component signal transduction system YycFG
MCIKKHNEELWLQIKELCSRLLFSIKFWCWRNKIANAKNMEDSEVLDGSWYVFLTTDLSNHIYIYIHIYNNIYIILLS